MELITAAAESGNWILFFQILVAMRLAWRVFKPFVEKQIAALVAEMAKQMSELRSEVSGLKTSVVEMSGSMKSLEQSNQKRFADLEGMIKEHTKRIDKIEGAKNGK